MNPETNPAGTSPAMNDPTPQSPPADQPRLPSVMVRPDAEPWTHPVNGPVLLDDLERLVQRFVIVPGRPRQALALWILHTYAFQLGEVSAYLRIESPEKRCGKTT